MGAGFQAVDLLPPPGPLTEQAKDLSHEKQQKGHGQHIAHHGQQKDEICRQTKGQPEGNGTPQLDHRDRRHAQGGSAVE